MRKTVEQAKREEAREEFKVLLAVFGAANNT